jgi:hypothetical protein
MGPIGFPETSVTIYQYTPRNTPEERTVLHYHNCKAVVPKLFRSTAPSVPYTHPQRPPTFFKKNINAVLSPLLFYILKNRLNKIIELNLMFYVLINKLKFIIFFMINNNASSNSLLNNMCLNKIHKLKY